MATRESWEPLGEALLERQSFAALLLVVDSRRGVSEMDIGLLDWAHRLPERTHASAQQIRQALQERGAENAAQCEGGTFGAASCQLFSALRG